MDIAYTTVARSTGEGRNGHARTGDGRLDLDLRVPQEMGGPGGATNPEQLFAAGYAGCFHSALKAVAQREQADVTGSEVAASVGIGNRPEGGFGLEVALDVSVPNVDHDTARALVEGAHQVCPYSHATRGNIDVTSNVV